jgi:oxalate decarboxylase/phosphoglucose isomerase-like protein (cupin superfamily)
MHSKTFLLRNSISSLLVSPIFVRDVNKNISYLFLAAPTSDKAPASPQGTVPEPFSYAFSQVKATQLEGGSVKIADSSTFSISQTIAAAEVTVEPGAMR